MTAERKSILFLSCDLVDSTSYKQKRHGWQDAFLNFYYSFSEIVGSLSSHENYEGKSLSLWKAVGDELIFTCEVKHEKDVYSAINLWLMALDQFESSKPPQEAFKVKGGAFIATFQGPDFESSIPKNHSATASVQTATERNRIALHQRNTDEFLFDYFGPSVDTGFRIFGKSNQRHFTMSIEVTWAVVSELLNQEHVELPENIVFTGSHFLKGVWNGNEYPIFAFDRHFNQPVNSAMRTLFPSSLKLRDVAKLCKECRDDDAWRPTLYLPDSQNPDLIDMRPEEISTSPQTTVEGFETAVPEDTSNDDPKLLPELAELLEDLGDNLSH